MQRADWLICLVWIQYGGICCVISCEFDEKRATKPIFVARFSSSTRNICFVAGHVNCARWKTGNTDENLQRNNVARQVKGFCVSCFAALGKCKQRAKRRHEACVYCGRVSSLEMKLTRNSWWRVRHNVMWELDLCCDHKIFLCGFILLFFYNLIVVWNELSYPKREVKYIIKLIRFKFHNALKVFQFPP